MKAAAFLLPVVAVALIVASSSIYIVDEREKALVLQFGQVKDVREDPGLGFKLPLIQNVVRYDGRILGVQTRPLEVTPLDDRRLVVDAFARWRISDVVRFRQALGVENVRAAQNRLELIVNAAIRQQLGAVPSGTVLSDDRTDLMNSIRDQARQQAEALGIEVIDVRLTRTDLPEQNLAATYARMRAEREREAADEIARGREAAQRVRASADRTVTEIVSEANRDNEVIRGEADARRNAIYADSFGRAPEFFAFSRSLTSYERALDGANTTMVVRPDGTFFNYMGSDAVRGLDPVPAPAVPEGAGTAAGGGAAAQ